MKTISTKVTSMKSACRRAALLWKELARTGSSGKCNTYDDLFNDRYIKFCCPCCEFNKEALDLDFEEKRCDQCPMFGFWSSNDKGFFDCEDNAYGEWTAVEKDETKKFASIIHSQALAALEYWESMQEMNQM